MWRRGLASSAGELRRTALHDLHVERGGKMVPFAGWSMPIQYSDQGIMASTLHTRTQASLFDVGHMAQLHFRGKDRVRFLNWLMVSDVFELASWQGRYSLLTNDAAGIIDDTIVFNLEEEDMHFVVVNAGCADKDIQHFRDCLSRFDGDCSLEVVEEHALIALQGPKAAAVLSKLADVSLDDLYFYWSRVLEIVGAKCFVTRTGYTGEDGFEISIPNSHAVNIAQELLKFEEVALSGLGARDTLRLEAGLCLYGNDLDEATSPIEAGLAWTISKNKRVPGAFIGSDVVVRQLEEGVNAKRVGIIVEGPPAREHTEIQSEEGESLGAITSGTHSPTLQKPIAMGYVTPAFAKVGTKLQVVVREKIHPATVVKMPFVPTKYYTPSK